ncbi:hypothetical protein SAMN02745216_04143 [Desulfatibacillum alkenivorans DSM 16219]|uniref:Uncharacterized protein n=1 Tax=Desulfatibacillum alkenivorans DSM 16219 TaxID=1121393 RepID=A0A1M6VP23_9BACT|nr:hypothetical protein SAMN02745216_04143 [Desulfatibacillum alkenivorans DSM 16219]
MRLCRAARNIKGKAPGFQIEAVKNDGFPMETFRNVSKRRPCVMQGRLRITYLSTLLRGAHFKKFLPLFFQKEGRRRQAVLAVICQRQAVLAVNRRRQAVLAVNRRRQATLFFAVQQFRLFYFDLASSSSLRTFRRILPTADLGSSSRNSMIFGTL